MKKRLLALTMLAMALTATSARAANPDSTKDCDTWSRASQPGPSGQPSYMQTGPGDIDNLQDIAFPLPSQPLPGGLYIHPNGNNAVVRNAATTTDPSKVTYLEVAGGGQYTGDGHTQHAGEGGFEQGRVYVQPANSYVTLHHDLFGPVRESGSNVWETSTYACLSVNVMGTNVRSPEQRVATPSCHGLPDCGY
ncbi:MAG: hypothetical protein ABR548_07920 [Actinomycetota bacterium]|nr:hypothetical protein [Actinomycetota bacterium]